MVVYPSFRKQWKCLASKVPKNVFFQGSSEKEQFLFLVGKENSSYVFFMHKPRKMLCIYCDSPPAGFTKLLMWLVRGLDHRCLVLQF